MNNKKETIDPTVVTEMEKLSVLDSTNSVSSVQASK